MQSIYYFDLFGIVEVDSLESKKYLTNVRVL